MYFSLFFQRLNRFVSLFETFWTYALHHKRVAVNFKISHLRFGEFINVQSDIRDVKQLSAVRAMNVAVLLQNAVKAVGAAHDAHFPHPALRCHAVQYPVNSRPAHRRLRTVHIFIHLVGSGMVMQSTQAGIYHILLSCVALGHKMTFPFRRAPRHKIYELLVSERVR